MDNGLLGVLYMQPKQRGEPNGFKLRLGYFIIWPLFWKKIFDDRTMGLGVSRLPYKMLVKVQLVGPFMLGFYQNFN